MLVFYFTSPSRFNSEEWVNYHRLDSYPDLSSFYRYQGELMHIPSFQEHCDVLIHVERE